MPPVITDSARAGAGRTVVAVLTALAMAGGAGAYLYDRAPQPTDVLVHSTVLVDDAALPGLGVAIVDGGTAGASTVLGWRTISLDGGGTADGGPFIAILAHGGLPLTGRSYWRVDICTPVVDGGHDPGQSFLGSQVTVVYDDDATESCRDGGPVIEAWEQGRSDAPFPCACALPGAGCLRPDGGPAPVLDGNGHLRTLNPGEWAGPGCTPKACIEISGVPSFPEACR